MKPRTCRVVIGITNEAGDDALYNLRPAAAADLAQSAAAFRLVKVSDPDPAKQAAYLVRLAVDGQVTCNCPQHRYANRCKHADALVAAGVLPSALLGILQERTMLLNEAERSLKLVTERALQLQTALAAIPPAKPKSRRRRVAEARAAA